MCGICGEFNYRESVKHARMDSVRRMNQRMIHRGPDDEGYFSAGSVGFGFRRLSIIDLEAGRQPMSNQTGDVTVVFNGEVYNFREIRAELESCGHVFRTKSDTEVIVHGYKQWGVNVLDHLNGMFGLAVWDAQNRQLMLARDRLGIKPLYYRIRQGTLRFSSEIRSLLAGCDERPEIDETGLRLFLQHRYTPSPFTILKDVHRLAPGARLVVGENREPAVDYWWRVSPAPFDRMPTDDEAAEEMTALYQRAVRRQLISDVPVGLLLSGGVDSGLLLALMKEVGEGWQTYSVGYGTSFRDDELADARGIANHFDCPNQAVYLNQETFENTLFEVADKLEEPVTASSAIPMFHLCRRARKDVKVVLMGQGPDELFGGYTRHVGAAYGVLWRALPEPARVLVGSTATKLTRSEWIRRATHSLAVPDRLHRYREILSICDSQTVRALMRDGIADSDRNVVISECWRDLVPLLQPTDELGGLQFLELRSTLPDELLMYADKISMANSLEVRVPYLDHEVVSYAERLNASFKIRYGQRKWLHKKVAARYLPKASLQKRKRGFASDVDGWLRCSVSSRMSDLLCDPEALIYRWLRQDYVSHIMDQHRSGACDNHKILYSLVILERVLRSYVS
jgi:asparagine synthase (glutamine-hydrolysing)